MNLTDDMRKRIVWLSEAIPAGESMPDGDRWELQERIKEMLAFVEGMQIHLEDIESSPRRIYLQVRGEDIDNLNRDDHDTDPWDTEGVTWSGDRISDSDIEYVHIDDYKALKKLAKPT